MAIRRISELDAYLSSGPGGANKENAFTNDNFKKSLFEISKFKDERLGGNSNENNYVSRQINGTDLISAMHDGLSQYFADTSYFQIFTRKLLAIMDLFGDKVENNVYKLTSFNFTDNSQIANFNKVNITDLSCTNLSVTNDIHGCALSAKWC